jgi:hypothetical protein
MNNEQLTKEVMGMKQTLARIEQKVDDQQKMQIQKHAGILDELFNRVRALEAKEYYRKGATVVLVVIGAILSKFIDPIINFLFSRF